MIANEFETLQEHPEWVTVLEAYRHSQENLPEEQTLVARFVEVAEVPTEELSLIHGQLIALDLIEFDIPDRHSGLMYKLTSLGKQMLRRWESWQKEQPEPEPNSEPEPPLTQSKEAA